MGRANKRKTEDKFIKFLNNLSLRKKLLLLYIFCVLFPLFFTDAFISISLYHNEKQEYLENMDNICLNIASDVYDALKPASDLSNSIYVNRRLYTFLDTEFDTYVDFYASSHEWLEQSGYSSYTSPYVSRIVFVVDNDTMISGGNIHTLDNVSDTRWYKDFVASGRNSDLIFYSGSEDGAQAALSSNKKVKLVRYLDYYSGSRYEKILTIDIDYTSVVDTISNKHYGVTAYICDGGKILMSTAGKVDIYGPYSSMTEEKKNEIGYQKNVNILNKEYTIYLIDTEEFTFFKTLKSNWVIVVPLVVLNIILPLVLVSLINESLSKRIGQLSTVFSSTGTDAGLVTVENITGNDEIAQLMHGYNDLVLRNRDLIKTIYENRLMFQESEIEKQRAELFAMRMQINPHFLFNCLESIRMHSLLNGEKDTSVMIEQLAALIRQVVDWEDIIPLSQELDFIENYLLLQQYRFGDRFTFTINVDDETRKLLIPKLTLATFVENSCVHGIEKKISGAKIMISADKAGERLVLEVEDTGIGMSSETAADLQETMQNSTFSDLQNSRHIGILNACMRLKMIAGNDVKFVFESEENIGTYIKIDMPILSDDILKSIENTEGGTSNDAD